MRPARGSTSRHRATDLPARRAKANAKKSPRGRGESEKGSRGGGAAGLILENIMFSEKQQNAFELYKSGVNMLITGPGGSGKTYLIKKFVEWAKENDKKIQACAMTGCASLLLECGAKTIHSWGGIGLANGNINEIAKRVGKHKYKSKPWKNIDILIIDEVSMMSKKIFDILDKTGRIARKNMLLPFGGIQVIMVGDFYQLPPVGNKDDPDTIKFCFESERWPVAINEIVQLKTIFRQKDNKYAKALNQIRIGRLKKSSYKLLLSRVQIKCNEDIKPTILLPLRKSVDKINRSELAKLKNAESKKYSIKMVKDTEGLDNYRKKLAEKTPIESVEYEYKNLKSSIMADTLLELKVGAQVMCIANIDMDGPHPLVNGSQGIVDSFVGDLPMVRFRDGQKRLIGYHTWSSESHSWIGAKQIPLIHAWAITIHKAQGVTLELAQIDAGQHIFECGQTYVALSRVKSLEGLYLTDFDPRKIKVNKKVQLFYSELS